MKTNCKFYATVAIITAVVAFSQTAKSQNIFPSSGNTGIGTATPSAKLDLVGDLKISQDVGGVNVDFIKFVDNTPGGYSTFGTVGAGNGVMYMNAAGTQNNLDLRVSNTSALYVKSNGNIGIGTTSPSGLLDVQLGGANYSTTGEKALIINKLDRELYFAPNLGDWSHSQISVAGDFGIFWKDQTGPNGKNGSAGLVIAAHASSSAGIRIDANGNVGIGTNLLSNNANHKLAVNGSIRAKEIFVEVGWADYVFLPDYRLKPLYEVESYIQSEGHLPGVPSEKEIEEQGVSLGEMSKIQMEKIEELTLYIIELQKRINALEADNN